SVVLDDHAQLPAAYPFERHLDAAGLGLAGRGARRRILDAMIDRIPYQVAEPLDEPLQQARLEQLVAPVDGELYLPARHARGLARRARESRRDVCDRNHAGAQRGVAQLSLRPVEARGELGHRIELVAELGFQDLAVRA